MKKMWIAGMLALLVGAGTLGALPAQASTSGRRNTALGLGAAAIYELVNGNTTAGIALGAGAAYGYKRYEDEKRYEDRYGYYGRGYRYPDYHHFPHPCYPANSAYAHYHPHPPHDD